MSIIRRKTKNNFVIIDKKPLEDKKLSWQAKGLLTYLLGRPADWKVFVSQLAGVSRNGRDATSNALQELVDNGYVSREIVRDGNGRVGGYDYTVCDEPCFEKPHLKQIEPFPEKPFTDKPFTENPSLLSNELLSNEITKERKKEESTADSLAPSEVFENDGLNNKPSDELTEQAVQWVKHLADKTGVTMHPIDRVTGKQVKYLAEVKARISEYGLDTMIQVTELKFSEWFHEEKMRKHLVVETLCRKANTEKYVRQLQLSKPKSNPTQGMTPAEVKALWLKGYKDADNGII